MEGINNENFGDDSQSEAHSESNKNEVPSDERILNELFKKSDREQKKRARQRTVPKLRDIEMCGPKGFLALKNAFDNYTPKRKNPYDNLTDVMCRIEHWAHTLYPKLKFEDFVSRAESLGSKRMVKTFLNKMRLDMPITDEDYKEPATVGEGLNNDREMSPFDEERGVIENGARSPSDSDAFDVTTKDATSSHESATAISVQYDAAVGGRSGEAGEGGADDVAVKRNAFFERPLSPVASTSIPEEPAQSVEPVDVAENHQEMDQDGEFIDDDAAFALIFADD